MADKDHEEIALVEGDDAPPDININPTETDTASSDPHMSDPEGLPPESYEADEDDDKGKEAGV